MKDGEICMGFDAARRVWRLCKSATGEVLFSHLRSEATPRGLQESSWEFPIFVQCRARYCIRPTALTLMEHEAAFSCGFLFAVVSFVLKRWDVSTLGRRVQESVSYFMKDWIGTPSLYIRAHSRAREVIWFCEFCWGFKSLVVNLLIGKRLFVEKWTTELSWASGYTKCSMG